jgi:hypothetical protein
VVALALLVAFGQQAELIHTSGANFVHNGNHVAVLGASVALEVHGFVRLFADAVLDLPCKSAFCTWLLPRRCCRRGYRHDDRIILIGVLHVLGGFRARHVHGCFFCNIGVTTMKMISRTSMMSAIGMTLGDAI